MVVADDASARGRVVDEARAGRPCPSRPRRRRRRAARSCRRTCPRRDATCRPTPRRAPRASASSSACRRRCRRPGRRCRRCRGRRSRWRSRSRPWRPRRRTCPGELAAADPGRDRQLDGSRLVESGIRDHVVAAEAQRRAGEDAWDPGRVVIVDAGRVAQRAVVAMPRPVVDDLSGAFVHRPPADEREAVRACRGGEDGEGRGRQGRQPGVERVRTRIAGLDRNVRCLTPPGRPGSGVDRVKAQARSSSATHSMCGVCGNMSTGRTRRSA